jgi:hypothetical protein
MCIPLITLVRHNIVRYISKEKAKDLTISLPVVYPLAFPTNIMGTSHQPLVDCREARLFGLLALNYCTGRGPVNGLAYKSRSVTEQDKDSSQIQEQSQAKSVVAKTRSQTKSAIARTMSATRSAVAKPRSENKSVVARCRKIDDYFPRLRVSLVRLENCT